MTGLAGKGGGYKNAVNSARFYKILQQNDDKIYKAMNRISNFYIREDDIMDVSNVGAADVYQYQPKTANDLKEEVRNTPDSEIKDVGVIVEISKDTPEAQGYRKWFSREYKMGNVGNMPVQSIGWRIC